MQLRVIDGINFPATKDKIANSRGPRPRTLTWPSAKGVIVALKTIGFDIIG